MEIDEESMSRTTWKIENYRFSWHKVNMFLQSSSFRISTHGGLWRLRLYPRGRTTSTEFIGIDLERVAEGPDSVTVDYEISVVDKYGESKYTHKEENITFVKGQTLGFPRVVRRRDVIGTGESIFLPDGTLTVECCIISKANEMNEPMQNLVQSTVVIRRHYAIWETEEINLRPQSKQGTVARKTSDHFELSVNLNSDSLSAIFQIKSETTVFRFIIGIFDSSGSVSLKPVDEYMFHSENPKVETSLISRSDLLNPKKGYLNEGCLKLFIEFHYSTGIDRSHVVLHSCDEMLEPCMLDMKDYSGEGPSAAHPRCCNNNDSLPNCLQNLYQEGTLLDFSIEVGVETLKAHKAVLCARSPYFKAMLENNMAEANENKVTISGFEMDTVRRMLTFMYTDKADDLDWKKALLLYSAADYFRITVLKSVCAEFLKKNLTADNVKPIQDHAVAYKDDCLKGAISVYLERRRGKAIRSLRRLPTRFDPLTFPSYESLEVSLAE